MTDDIKKACEVLQAGGIILYPTDTIWGIGCDATNEKAVQRIYELKQRTDNKAMLVLMDAAGKLETYVDEVPDIAWDLIEVTDKPLTLIFTKAKNLATNLLAGDGSVGIRITREAFSKRLCEAFRKPLVSTSANISGEPFPSCFSDISETIKQGVDYVVQFRQEEKREAQPSGIIKLDAGGLVQIIR